MGSAICASRVKLQHLPLQVGAQRWEEVGAGCRLQVGPGPGHMPAETPLRPVTSLQEQWDRLLVLYPTSLAIFSEEADGLCFKVGPSLLQTRPREAPCTWGWEGAAAQEEPVCLSCMSEPATCPSRPHPPSLLSWSVWSQPDVGKEGGHLASAPCIMLASPQPPAGQSPGGGMGPTVLLEGLYL